MPIYEYHCEQCGEDIEIIQKITEPPTSQCPMCQSDSLRKKTSISAFHLKGSGWYKDGYNGTNPNQSQPETKSEDTESSTTESKSESKKPSESTSDPTPAPTSTAAESASTAAG